MANVFDAAKYILTKTGTMTAMKLQKLVYYSQAWSLVWDEAPLFDDRIEAWANGPVAPSLYGWHRGTFNVSADKCAGDDSALSGPQRDTVDAVLTYYADKSSQWLSDLTHAEDPWKDARQGLAPGERGNHEITHASMAEYYSRIASEQQ
jgi:uncharacterized phage-associated protein